MRERAAATIFMWIALAASVAAILSSLKYYSLVPSPSDSTKLIEQITLVPDQWQLGAAILIFVLIIAAAGATTAIWQSARHGEDQAMRHTEKAKRDNRDARIRRLLATMDDEELDALEHGRYVEDGERLSLEALLRKRD